MKKQIVVTTFQRDDANGLEAVAKDTGMDIIYEDKVKRMIKADELVLFAAKDDSYIGRVSLWLAPVDEELPRQKYPGVPFINALEVNDSARRQGVATLLMQAAEDEARKRNNAKIALGVEPDNVPAISLYEKLGYIFDGNTYESCWDEDDNGNVKKVCVQAKLMVKEL